MKKISDAVKRRMLKEARKVSENSYSPYSKFPVGSAVLTADGKIFTGTNVENASYGLTICAERFAMGNAIAHSKEPIIAIALFSPNSDITPCGACRQFINEFGKAIQVIYMENGKMTTKSSNELLPHYFSKNNLK